MCMFKFVYVNKQNKGEGFIRDLQLHLLISYFIFPFFHSAVSLFPDNVRLTIATR
jgi:hypothetical protein